LETGIRELYGDETGDAFQTGFSEMEDQAEGVDAGASFREGLLKFVLETGKSLGLGLLMSRLGL
jgi:hypothetical protein